MFENKIFKKNERKIWWKYNCSGAYGVVGVNRPALLLKWLNLDAFTSILRHGPEFYSHSTEVIYLEFLEIKKQT